MPRRSEAHLRYGSLARERLARPLSATHLARADRVGIFETNTLDRLKQVTGTEPSTDKRLLVGVLPHPFCNPTVRGCGYCTFPHERFRTSTARSVVDAVIEEIIRKRALAPDQRPLPVDGLYLGGGTANLTPSASMTTMIFGSST